MLFLQKALVCLTHDVAGNNIQRHGVQCDFGKVILPRLIQQLEHQKDQNHMSRLGKKPRHLIQRRMVQHAMVGVQDDHHDQIHKDSFQNDPPKEAGFEHASFFHQQEPCQNAEKKAQNVQKHKINMLRPASYSTFIHVLPALRSFRIIPSAIMDSRVTLPAWLAFSAAIAWPQKAALPADTGAFSTKASPLLP